MNQEKRVYDEENNVKIKLTRYRWPDELEHEKRRKRTTTIVVVGVIVAFSLGWVFGDVFSRPSNIIATSNEVARFERVYNRLLSNWYFTKEMEDASTVLIENAIKGMIDRNGDPHTAYMTREESSEFNSSIDLEFVGIGVQYFMGDGLNLITRVYKESPAENAGLQAGDILYSVDDVIVTTIEENDDLRNYIIGEVGTTVKIVVDRQGEMKTFNVTRGRVNALTWGEMLDDTIAYLEISSFGNNLRQSTEVYLQYFKDMNAKKLIIDFRDNGGGYLDAIQELSTLFFEDNVTVYYEELTSGQMIEYVVDNSKASHYPFDRITVLINESTASAAEVFALALKENVNAELVGSKTYGKGTVQTQIYDSNDDSYLKFTMAKWFSPSMKSIHEVGIIPDYEVFLSDIFYEQYVIFEEGDAAHYDSVHEAVAYIQKGLRFLGYHTGRMDSYYDLDTKNALIAFKKDLGLSESDVINQEVVQKIYASVLNEWSQRKSIHDIQLHKAIEVIRSES